jgi:periplasmic protein CpxP/Spy
MKKIIVLALAVIGVQLAASAQEKRDTIRSHHKTEARVKMKEELNLTKEQSEKLKAIHADTKTKMQALRDDQSLSKEDRKAKAGAIMKERKEKTDAILNAEQKEKMKQWEAKKKDHMKAGGKKQWKDRKEKMKTEKEVPKTEQ